MTRRFKHKKLGRIVIETDINYKLTNINNKYITDSCNHISKYIVENSLDREEIIDDDWITKVYEWCDEEFGIQQFRKLIEKYIPKISEEEINNCLVDRSWDIKYGKMIDLLKSKGVYKE